MDQEVLQNQMARECNIEDVTNELKAVDYLTSIQGYGMNVSTLTISGDKEQKTQNIDAWAEVLKGKCGERNAFRVIVVEH